MRTVKELKAILEHAPEDSLVVVMSDPEGNRTHWWDTIGHCFMEKDVHGWREANEMDSENAVSVVAIWPGYGESFDE